MHELGLVFEGGNEQVLFLLLLLAEVLYGQGLGADCDESQLL